MTRELLAAGALVLGTVAARPASRADEQQRFPSGVELVRIDVVVLDRGGTPVTGLGAADFEVAESGRPHEIVTFEPVVVRAAATVATTTAGDAATPRVSEPLAAVPEESRCLLVFFDDVHVSPPSSERVRAQLAAFLEREVRAGDWVTLVSPLAGLKWTARTAFEHRQLPAVVSALRGQLVRRLRHNDPSDFEAMRKVEYEGRVPTAPPGRNDSFRARGPLVAEEVYAVARRRVRQTLIGLEDAIQSLAGFRGRKSLILYSEGFIKSPSMTDYDRVVDSARRAHVSVYFVDPQGIGTGLPDAAGDVSPSLITLDTEAAGASFIATATGGRVGISNDVTALLRQAAFESSAYYLIGFRPTAGPPGERKLKVRVRREGLTLRAPDRYIVGEPQTKGEPMPPAMQALQLVTDSTDVPLRVGALFLAPPGHGRVPTTIAVELGGVDGDMRERRLTLSIEARPSHGGEPVRDIANVSLRSSTRPAAITRDLLLTPGLWQARVVVRDAKTERLGSALHSFEVPGVDGLRLSSPVVTDALEAAAVPRPRLRLDRTFRSGMVLYCQYRVFGAALDPTSGRPRVSASYALVRSGRVLREGEGSTIEPSLDGQLLRMLAFDLTGFESGQYTLILGITDLVTGETRRTVEPFTVVPAG